MNQTRPPLNRCLLCAAVLLLGGGLSVFGDDLILKNGLTLRGSVFVVPGIESYTALQNSKGELPSASFLMVDDGVRRYFVAKRQKQDLVSEAELSRLVTYRIEHQKYARTTGFPIVGPMKSVTPFDEFGRREVVLNVAGNERPLVQEIVELRPDYARLVTSRQVWDYSIDTDILPAETIRKIIEKNSNRDDPAERQAAVKFYLQAEMFPQALQELNDLTRRFPELQEWAERPQREVFELQARRGLYELQRRRQSGQHQLAYYIAGRFPADEVSADVLREAQEVVQDYEQVIADGERALMLLDTLQAELPMETADRIRSLRIKLAGELRYETLPRLGPFLQAADDSTVPPAEKLALAYSGWVLGHQHAVTDLDQAIRLWEARFLALEYLRIDQDPLKDQEILGNLNALEGVSVERLAQMAPLLPLPEEAPELVPGVASVITLPQRADRPDMAYTIILPPEYSPQHSYPLLVALRGEGRSFDVTAKWWAGDPEFPGWAQRRGYIVIAPHYTSETSNEYNGNEWEHATVLESVNHVRKRFHVDSDRIFLTGHGMGGTACFDIAMSHPGIFAGAIPFTGYCDRTGISYCENDQKLSWYVMMGERDRDTVSRNALVLNRMMRPNLQDVIVSIYKGRGMENYHEEQDRLFEWMELCRRPPLSESIEFEANSLRPSDNRFFWMQAGQFKDGTYAPLLWDEPRRKNARVYSGSITSGGTIYVRHPGKSTTLWLSPETFDFSNRCEVRINGRSFHNDYVTPSAEALLSDLRERGDRQRLFWARLDLNNY